jgi:hypothetical protein
MLNIHLQLLVQDAPGPVKQALEHVAELVPPTMNTKTEDPANT